MYQNYYYDDNGFRQEPQDNEPDGNWFKRLVQIITIFLLMILIASVMGGCRTVEYVPVITTRTDTLIITKHQRDSIFVHDSIHVNEKQKGDTVWLEVEKWHIRYIDRSTHDTTYISTHDTVPDPYPVEVEVAKPLTWWQQLRLWLGTVALIAILAAAVYGIAKLYLKLKPGMKL